MRWTSLFLTILLTVSSGWGRNFLSADGKRAIKAHLEDYDSEKKTITIRREDGKVFTNALSIWGVGYYDTLLRFRIKETKILLSKGNVLIVMG